MAKVLKASQMPDEHGVWIARVSPADADAQGTVILGFADRKVVIDSFTIHAETTAVSAAIATLKYVNIGGDLDAGTAISAASTSLATGASQTPAIDTANNLVDGSVTAKVIGVDISAQNLNGFVGAFIVRYHTVQV